MISLEQNDMIILQNQKSVQSNIMDSKNNSSGAIFQVINWYQKAAENGDIKAQYNIATLYINGEGIERNLEKALYWYQKAAENGDIDAQNNLATLYEDGNGIKKNLEKAFYWYQKAAENGNIEAQYNLALSYENGAGKKKI